VLRHLLGAYTSSPPHLIELEAADSGKPRMVGHDAPQFSIAHTDGLGVVAIAARTVGIDVQHCDPDLNIDAVARQSFSATEISALRALPDADRRAAFFRTWCRKEAYLKAIGTGWRLRLNEMPEDLARPGPLSGRHEVRGRWGHWQVVDVSVPTGYACAVAARGLGWAVAGPHSFVFNHGWADAGAITKTYEESR